MIGEGGFGQVYAARDRDLRRDVAVKLLYPSAHGSVAQALEEARAASALNHPNILTVYETIEHGDRAAIVTELVGGQSLRQILLNRNKSLPLTEALPIARQITAALQEAHSTGITHRDVKPENVLVRLKDGLVKLVDFGLAVDASDGNRVSGVAERWVILHQKTFRPSPNPGLRRICARHCGLRNAGGCTSVQT